LAVRCIGFVSLNAEGKNPLIYSYRSTVTQNPSSGNDLTNLRVKTCHDFQKLRRWAGMVPPLSAKLMTISYQLYRLNSAELPEGTMPILLKNLSPCYGTLL
jgi:hypothetical protein